MRPRPFASVLFIALTQLACPGRLEDPERFSEACPGGLSAAAILRSCATAGCHAASQPAGGLDLASPDPAHRLIGVASTGCSGETLVTAEGQGYFFDKLTAQTPRCGARMPVGSPALTAAEVQCLRAWLAAEAGEVAP